jgi:hypothetical protein
VINKIQKLVKEFEIFFTIKDYLVLVFVSNLENWLQIRVNLSFSIVLPWDKGLVKEFIGSIRYLRLVYDHKARPKDFSGLVDDF